MASRFKKSRPTSKTFPTKQQIQHRHNRNNNQRYALPMSLILRELKVISGYQNYESQPSTIFYKTPKNMSRIYKHDNKESYLYQVFDTLKMVGEGSFGQVFKVRSREDNTIYAIKRMKSVCYTNFGRIEIANHEEIEHQNCVKFFMGWTEMGLVHIQLEYCNLSLAQYSDRIGPIPENQLWEILFDMLKALEYLHSKKFIHRDVKPANIMMNTSGIYKLADFGILIKKNKNPPAILPNISEGDSKYLPPEVFTKKDTFTSDIFSLGISLLELATNILLPGMGENWHLLRNNKIPQILYYSTTSEFSDVIERMMISIPVRRPLARDLLKFPAIKRIFLKDLIYPRTNYINEEAVPNVDPEEVRNGTPEHNMGIPSNVNLHIGDRRRSASVVKKKLEF